jgi:hypothetical protein
MGQSGIRAELDLSAKSDFYYMMRKLGSGNKSQERNIVATA